MLVCNTKLIIFLFSSGEFIGSLFFPVEESFCPRMQGNFYFHIILPNAETCHWCLWCNSERVFPTFQPKKPGYWEKYCPNVNILLFHYHSLQNTFLARRNGVFAARKFPSLQFSTSPFQWSKRVQPACIAIREVLAISWPFCRLEKWQVFYHFRNGGNWGQDAGQMILFSFWPFGGTIDWLSVFPVFFQIFKNSFVRLENENSERYKSKTKGKVLLLS